MKHLWITLAITVIAAITFTACASLPESGDVDYGSGTSTGHQH